MKTVDIWQCPQGAFIIPRDVPRKFRKDGWFDHRFKHTEELKEYLAEMMWRQQYKKKPLTWRRWQRNPMIKPTN
jgi:hypothetical protein